MKMVSRVLLTAAVIAAFAASAMAADKLIVKNAAGTADAFKVDDTGKLTIRNAGNTADAFVVENTGVFQVPGSLKFDNTLKFMGIGTDSPIAVFNAVYSSAAAPFVLERQLDANGAVSLTAVSYAMTAGGASPAPLIGSGMIFGSFRGTKASPTNLVSGDRLGFLVFQGNAGGGKNTAAINAYVDAGTVSSTSLPTYLQFQTTADGSTARAERFRIAGDGRIRLSNQPAAPVSGVTACTVGDMILDAAGGFLYLCTVTGNTWKKATFN